MFMNECPPENTPEVPCRYRWVLRYGTVGDLKFISHRDTLRMLKRAMVRAGIPIRYSQGFNPQPRIMIPIPRPVGIASRCELAVLETTSDLEPAKARDVIDEATPAEMPVYECRSIAASERFDPCVVRYELDAGDRSTSDLAERMARILAADSILIERLIHKTKSRRSLNVRQYIEDMSLDGQTIEFALRITGQGSAKPAEIAGLFDFDTSGVCHRITRTEVEWR